MPVPKVNGSERTRREDGGWRRKREDAGKRRLKKQGLLKWLFG